ncbi:hypothetical protein EBR04_00970 [bacterium]|nr:hypothetical protein [bacterium]
MPPDTPSVSTSRGITMSTGFIRSPHAYNDRKESPTQTRPSPNTSRAYRSDRSDHHVRARITTAAGMP